MLDRLMLAMAEFDRGHKNHQCKAQTQRKPQMPVYETIQTQKERADTHPERNEFFQGLFLIQICFFVRFFQSIP